MNIHKKRLMLLLLFGVFGLILLPFNFNTIVLAGYDGDYYFYDFDSDPDHVKYINDTVSGVNWFYMRPTYVPQVYGGYAQTYNNNWVLSRNISVFHTLCTLEIDKDFKEINQKFTWSAQATDRHHGHLNFSDGNNNLLFQVRFLDNNAGANDEKWYIYDEDLVLLGSDEAMVGSTEIWLNMTINSTTEEYNVGLEGFLCDFDVWFSTTNFSFIDKIDYYFDNDFNPVAFRLNEIFCLPEDEEQQNEEFAVWIKPIKSTYYTGDRITICTQVPESYNDFFWLRIEDANDPNGKLVDFYPIPEGYFETPISIRYKDQYGNNYDMGTWHLKLANYNLPLDWTYDYITTHNFVVDKGDNPTVMFKKTEYTLTEPIDYYVTNALASTRYYVVLRNLHGYNSTALIWSDENGDYEGNFLNNYTEGIYTLYIYNYTDWKYLNESQSVIVGDVSWINQYKIIANENYNADSRINFLVKRTQGDKRYYVHIIDDDGELMYSRLGYNDEMEIHWRHNTTMHGLGDFTIWVFDWDADYNKYNSVFDIIYVRDSTLSETESYNLLVGVALCFGLAGFFAFKLDSFMVFPIIAGALAWIFSQNIAGYQLFPSEFGIGLMVVMGLFVVVAWLAK